MKRILLILCLCALPLVAFAEEKPAAAAKPEQQPVQVGSSEQSAPASIPKSQPQLSLMPSLQAPAPKTAAAAFRLGVVDINRISGESEMGKKAQSLLKAQQSKLQKQIEGKKKQLEKAKADIERQMPTIPPQQRESKAREFQKKVEEFQKFGMNAEKNLMENQEKLTRALLTAIEQSAGEIGAASGLSAVVVRRELLYLASGVEVQDISEAVVKALNEKSAKETKK